ncbi:phosphodiester glycosidase family protein [Fodinisporobacter ferrooxydans]|uniref:Phosphodiester glycosidase family protein n=1 Tax=Fodinisporobacter ferrooxydans TaxID=2901836 RepID=A0ABY4CJY1_9BACL|nr:phosphodiester glycosidase family protein [Alicyclobacillaceae bacterium MYW30-H2]
MRQIVKKGRNNQSSRRWTVWIVVFSIFLYGMISTSLLVLYGPFENIRRTVIGAILTSRHPWLIEPFYSKAALAKYQPVSFNKMEKGNLQTKSFANVHDSKIDVIPIHSARYSGQLLIIHDPKRIHVAVTKQLGIVGETVSQMAQDHQAIAAINAGGFYDGSGKGTGGMPMGLTLSDGKYVAGDTDTHAAQPMIALTNQGELKIGQYTLNQLKEMHVTDAVSFGPQLVQNGKPYLSGKDGSWGLAPRSAIGQRKDGSILLLALSGRGDGGIGASLLDLEKVMLDNGAWTAANLDGGYSSELYYNKKLLVPPSNPLGERYVATSFIVTGNNQ